MKYAKPYPYDYRRPHDAEEIPKKKLPYFDKNVIIGFFDGASPQTTANTQRFWPFGKPIVCKNSTKYKANMFGFYALNGNSVVDFEKNSKKESICALWINPSIL